MIKAPAGGLAEKWPRPQVLVKIPLDELGLCMGALRSATTGVELVDVFHAGNLHPEWRGELSKWLEVLGQVAGPVSVHAAHMDKPSAAVSDIFTCMTITPDTMNTWPWARVALTSEQCLTP